MSVAFDSSFGRLEVIVILIGQRHLRSIVHLLLVLLQDCEVDLDFWGSERRLGDEVL